MGQGCGRDEGRNEKVDEDWNYDMDNRGCYEDEVEVES